MKAIMVNTVINEFNSLLLDEKEYALDIIKKALTEARREFIFKRAKKARENYKKG